MVIVTSKDVMLVRGNVTVKSNGNAVALDQLLKEDGNALYVESGDEFLLESA